MQKKGWGRILCPEQAKRSVCRWSLLRRTDKCSFTHFVTWHDVAVLEFDVHLNRPNETPDDLTQPPFPFALLMGEDGARWEGWDRDFVRLKSDFTAHDSSKDTTIGSAECRILSLNHKALPTAICKAFPNLPLSGIPVLWGYCETWTCRKDQAQRPLGAGRTYRFAAYNLTRIYKHLRTDVSILFHLGICANILIHTVNFTVNAKFKISQPENTFGVWSKVFSKTCTQTKWKLYLLLRE